ncbi:MAG TPA: hypothetical protein VNQ79_27320 [Blastocatellia bacterium]|nr:hypothetical protein [Blastocatellia bacterium]
MYGVYPVECKGVRVEKVRVSQIKDAAIYVGQSRLVAHHFICA